ncbi:MAG: hypothetical protein P1P77_11555 [Spirochaetaceae bacterium]|nr:hypothetical protein [Spirochaetaceae bacterium]
MVAAALVISGVINRKKTLKALKIAGSKFFKILSMIHVFIIAAADYYHIGNSRTLVQSSV